MKIVVLSSFINKGALSIGRYLFCTPFLLSFLSFKVLLSSYKFFFFAKLSLEICGKCFTTFVLYHIMCGVMCKPTTTMLESAIGKLEKAKSQKQETKEYGGYVSSNNQLLKQSKVLYGSRTE